MSKVISVLEKMASDAAMNSESAIADLVAVSGINDGQMQAIKTNNIEGLVENTNEVSKITFFIPLVPAEDDEPEEDKEDDDKTETKDHLATVSNF